MEKIKIFSHIALLIFLYYVVYYVYVGIINPIPALGDSWDYHIPIAKTLLDGSFLHPEKHTIFSRYYPASSEIFLALFMLFHIPLTLSNLFAIIVLFFVCWKLGRVFKLPYYYALLFASTFCSLTVIVRWMNAISIDIWVAVFYFLTIILLENPQKKLSYFLKLGLLVGMIVGSKYTAPLILLPLFIIYFKQIISVISFKRIVIFLIPFSVFGLFWYIRNYLVVQNPFFPLPILGFPGKETFGGQRIWNIALSYPLTMMNGIFGEYKMWSFAPLLAIILSSYHFFIKKGKLLDTTVTKLFILGIINLLIYSMLPTSQQPWIMVSSLRYSLTTFIPLVLGFFILGRTYKKDYLIGYISIAGSLNILTMAFYPKLLFVYLPLALFLFYIFERNKNSKA